MSLPVHFMRDFKQAGFTVNNEPEFLLRLKEAGNWQFALGTLLANGQRIGIHIQRTAPGQLSVQALASRLGLGIRLVQRLELLAQASH